MNRSSFTSEQGSDDINEEWTPPAFQPEWEDEFKQSSHNPVKMQIVSLISMLYYAGHSLGTIFWRQSDDVGGGHAWLFFTWLPEILCAAQHCAWMCTLGWKPMRPFCIKYYNLICTYIVITSYLATIIPSLIWEYRLAKFHGLVSSPLYLTIQYGDYFPPNRTCTINASAITDTQFVASCNSSVLSGTVYIGFIFWNLLPRICRIKPAFAVFSALFTGLALAMCSLAVGLDAWTIITCVVFQLAAGLGTASFCALGERISRDKFAILKATQFAGVQNRDLLYTLVPPNVVARLTASDSTEMLGRELQHCIIMFCSLELRDTDLNILDAMFSSFDEAVARSGMFKYQHVGDWYIVACPRAACPFDEFEQSGDPGRHVKSMVWLGLELQSIALAKDLWLRVGISCGSVAGAVIGVVRSFYCLYGDTVNTAARMCKYGERSQLHCTSNFTALVNPAACMVRIEDRGCMEIKGKGQMRTYGLIGDTVTRTVGMVQLVVADVPQNNTKGPTDLRHIVQASAGEEHARHWLSDPSRRILKYASTFVDPELEKQFVAAAAPGQRRLLTAGLLLHALSIPMQWRLAGAGQNPPPDTFAFARLRPPSDVQTVRDLLSDHWAVSWCTTLALLAAIWLWQSCLQLAGRAFIALLLAHLVLQAIASQFSAIGGDPWSWILTLGTGACIISGWLGPLSVRGALILGIASAGSFYAALPPRAAYATEAALILALSIGVVLVVWANNHGQRVRFLLRELCKAQLQSLRGILHDLIPPSIARTMIRISARPPPETCRVAVLQLDICNFTVMSQTIPPLDLARLVHKLFTSFDHTVQKHRLFKMDTIGDAYIVAGLLSDTHATHRMCRGLLAVAKTMIDTLEEHRRETGQEVHCRIGVAIGSVVAGVLGKLQPRFHIQGQAVQAAEVRSNVAPQHD